MAIQDKVWERASGSVIADVEGRQYIDFTSGVIVANAGHGNQRIVEALKEYLNRPLLHCYKYPFEDKVRLEKELLAFVEGGFTEVHFGVTGSEVIETSLRISTRHMQDSGKSVIVSFRNAFHGKSLGAAMISDIARYKPETLIKGTSWSVILDYPCDTDVARDVLRRLDDMGDTVGAIYVECVQGSSLNKLAPEFLAYARVWCDRHDALLVVDEIQTGFYRLGEKFCYFQEGVIPDIVCIGKGLTSSLPLSGLLLGAKAATLIDQSADTSTHAANPLAVVSALACLAYYQSEEFERAHVASREAFSAHMAALRSIKGIQAVWHGGVFGGLVADPTVIRPERLAAFVECCKERGVFLAAPIGRSQHIIKFSPPLVITPAELEAAFAIIEAELGVIG